MKINEERIELEKLLINSSDKIGKDFQHDDPSLKTDPVFTENFVDLHKECDKQAKKLIQHITGFLFSDTVIIDNPFLKNKMQIDMISLSGMLYQLKTNELMQKTLMEEVRAGALHPRMFEVFGQLSKTIGELNKQLLQTTEAIKHTYRDLKNDIRERNQDIQAIGQGNMMRNEGGLVALGTKELIKETKKLKAAQYDENIEDVEEIK